MFDGIGDNTEVWRGRAAYLAGPKPLEDAVDNGQGQRKTGPLINHAQKPYLRSKVYLPLVPGRLLSSMVAIKRPDAAELLVKVMPHWDSLQNLCAVSRVHVKTDAMVLSDLLEDMGCEFTTLVSSGFKKEAKAISSHMGDVESLISSIDSYPTLEECVVEAAKRTLSFVENADPGHDVLVAGGITVALASTNTAMGTFQLAEKVRPSFGNRRPTCHPFLGGKVKAEFLRSVTTSGIDPETTETCMTAHGGRELGLLLSDLCSKQDAAVYVKTIARNSDVYGKLDLDATLAVRFSPTSVCRLELPLGLSPQDCLVHFSEHANGIEFPVAATLFTVTAATEYTHLQDFIVDGGAILLSYVPGWSAEGADKARLSERVLKLRSSVDAVRDVAISGEAVCDRSIAAAMAVRVRTHGQTPWARKAPFHRVRVAYSKESGAVIAAIRVCGSESHFGIPYDRIIRKLKEKRNRSLKHIHRDPDTGRKMMRARYYGCGDAEVPSWPKFEQAARAVLSRKIDDFERIETESDFLREIGSEIWKGDNRPLQNSRAMIEVDFDPLMED
jgi:hypothetical protein